MNNNIKVGVIGNEKMAVQCMSLILNEPKLSLDFIVYNPKLINNNKDIIPFAEKNNINCFAAEKLNTPETSDFISKYKPDYIFSINNFRIIKKEIIDLPTKGIINFHDAYLPNYKGVNVPFWVILNGEKKHGVTWHFVNEGIDTGDIVIQKEFDVPENSTASSLTLLLIKKGVESFQEVINVIANDKIERIKQNPEGEYYSYKMFPDNNGIINFNNKYENIDRLVRGLNYFPFENKFCTAKIQNKNKFIIVNSISKIEKTNTIAGEVVKIDEDNFWITCSDSIISIDDMMLDYNNFLSPINAADILNIKVGDIIN